MRKYVVVLCLLYSQSHYAFDLFEADRGKNHTSTPQVETPQPQTNQGNLPSPFIGARIPPPSRPKPPQKLLPQKDFILKGTSIIGTNRTVILKGPDNKEFMQKVLVDDRTPITGYTDYYLLSVTPREVSIEYPENAPCKNDNLKQGIKCSPVDNGKVAILSLTQSKALPPPPPPQPPAPETPASPEEANQNREEQRKKRQELYKNFKRKVIKEEDVPPGMRVVRTPFGDRLVPIK